MPTPEITKYFSEEARRKRAESKNIGDLADLLFDPLKPEGQEAVPKEQWLSVLDGPCGGDNALIAAVCAYECHLRDETVPDLKFEIPVPDEAYLLFVFNVFSAKETKVGALWNIEISDWYPEEEWDQKLAEVDVTKSEAVEMHKQLARRLKLVRETKRFTFG